MIDIKRLTVEKKEKKKRWRRTPTRMGQRKKKNSGSVVKWVDDDWNTDLCREIMKLLKLINFTNKINLTPWGKANNFSQWQSSY